MSEIKAEWDGRYWRFTNVPENAHERLLLVDGAAHFYPSELGLPEDDVPGCTPEQAVEMVQAWLARRPEEEYLWQFDTAMYNTIDSLRDLEREAEYSKMSREQLKAALTPELKEMLAKALAKLRELE